MRSKSLHTIDINADLGEGAGFDAQILNFVSSANIACGGHTGDAASMTQAVRLAKAAGVAIGAHPSFVDPDHFGRRIMHPARDQLFQDLCQQLSALQEIADSQQVTLKHLKPHGALYNQAAYDSALGAILIEVILACDSRLVLVTLAGSPLVQQAQAAGIQVIEEAFADRRYQSDGRLVPRNIAGACIDEVQGVMQQCLGIIEQQQILSIDGKILACKADSLCVHGDGAQALQFVQSICAGLREQQIIIEAPRF
jgi:UPF0271 protein